MLLLIIKQLFKQRDKAVVDFQKAIIHGEKGAINRKYIMDDKMEDKICDLYDLFVQVTTTCYYMASCRKI
jgi:hypothetical protein